MLSYFKTKIQIVELKNGKYAVMKTFLGEKTFFDSTPLFNYWIKSTNIWFADCQLDTIEEAELQYQKATGNVVKRVIL
jgi:hypothetical protein